jgi:hypothetical protein
VTGDDQREALVDLALLGLGAVAAYYVLKTPSLRRAAWHLLKYGIVTAAPTVLWQETTRAWAESAHRTANSEPQAAIPALGTRNSEVSLR